MSGIYRTRFMILVLRCLISLAVTQNNPRLAVEQKLIDDCVDLINDLRKQHGGE